MTASDNVARWARDLRGNDKWRDALNAAFDRIGFTEDYVQKVVDLRRANLEPAKDGGGQRSGYMKAVKDNVWGMIEFDQETAHLVDSPLLQRLRQVSQLGLSNLTYPTANHTRFEHSLGVYHVVRLLLQECHRTVAAAKTGKGDGITPHKYEARHERLITHAALLHDIGHAAFSHVSEQAFESLDKVFFDGGGGGSGLCIGPYSVREFLRDFRRIRYGIHDRKSDAPEPSQPLKPAQAHDGKEAPRFTGYPKKHLAELLSAAIVTSARFDRFYTAITTDDQGQGKLDVGRDGEVPLSVDACSIACLMLGDSIESSDIALPQFLSGAIDADKIDYLVRDAKACGISTNLDLPRIFLRAGVYKVPHNKIQSTNQTEDVDIYSAVIVFLIDQSGTDATRELQNARLSLYQRVYHHPFTRAAESVFHAMLADRVAHGEDLDFLDFWALPEEVLLWNQPENGKAVLHARALRGRAMPKRAASFGFSNLVQESPRCLDQWQEPIEKGRVALLRVWLTNLHSDPASALDLADAIAAEAKNIANNFPNQIVQSKVSMPETGSEPEVFIIPPIFNESASTPYVRKGDQIVPYGQGEASYHDSGALQSQMGFVRTSPDWAPLVMLAFQKLLHTQYNWTYKSDLGPLAPGCRELTLDGLFRPLIDIVDVCGTCKIDSIPVVNLQKFLAEKGYYDKYPRLYPSKLVSSCQTLAADFSVFRAGGGWSIDKDGMAVAEFLSQFPPSLRDEMRGVLKRVVIWDDIWCAERILQKVDEINVGKGGRKLLVPLSPSSGNEMRTALKGIGFAGGPVYSGLDDALADARKEDVIIFIDDNIASGTQVTRQLDIYFSNSRRPDAASDLPPIEANYHRKPLAKRDRQSLQARKVYFVFAAGHPDGRDTLLKRTDELELVAECLMAEDLRALAGDSDISPELQAFLDAVGTGVGYHRFLKEGKSPKEALALARKHALGYDGIKGLAVTLRNVPTSTVTALWCPGAYHHDTSLLDSDKAALQPWLPLFLRSGMQEHVVLP